VSIRAGGALDVSPKTDGGYRVAGVAVQIGCRSANWRFGAAFLDSGEGVSSFGFWSRDDVGGPRTVVDQCEAEVQLFARLWRGAGGRAGSGVAGSVGACAVAPHGGKSLVASCCRVCNLLRRLSAPFVPCLVLRFAHSQVPISTGLDLSHHKCSDLCLLGSLVAAHPQNRGQMGADCTCRNPHCHFSGTYIIPAIFNRPLANLGLLNPSTVVHVIHGIRCDFTVSSTLWIWGLPTLGLIFRSFLGI